MRYRIVLRAVHDQRLVGRSTQDAVQTSVAGPPSQEAVQQRVTLIQKLPSGGDLEDVSITFWCALVCQYSPWLYLLRLHRAGRCLPAVIGIDVCSRRAG